MDPNTAYQDLLAYLEKRTLCRHDRDAAAASARELLRWLDRGGFPPLGRTREEVRTVCCAILRELGQ